MTPVLASWYLCKKAAAPEPEIDRKMLRLHPSVKFDSFFFDRRMASPHYKVQPVPRRTRPLIAAAERSEELSHQQMSIKRRQSWAWRPTPAPALVGAGRDIKWPGGNGRERRFLPNEASEWVDAIQPSILY